jgi:hypothetical protein
VQEWGPCRTPVADAQVVERQREIRVPTAWTFRIAAWSNRGSHWAGVPEAVSESKRSAQDRTSFDRLN